MSYKTIKNFIDNDFNGNNYSFKISNKAPFKNSRLVRLTADEYYKLVSNEISKDYKNNYQKLQDQRRRMPNEISIDEMKDLMRKGTKFDAPWFHISDTPGIIPHFQEGLHRILAASDVYGKDARFPVWLGYEGNEWNDIESGDIDSFIENMNQTRKQNEINKKQIEEQERLKQLEQEKKDAALWFKLNGVEDVDDATLERYAKEMDALFDDDLY